MKYDSLIALLSLICSNSSRVNGEFIPEIKRVLLKLQHSLVRTQSSGVMKYFEMEEKRLKSFLRMEELWGKEGKEDKKVRSCPKSCVCGAFSKAEVLFIAL